MNNNRNFIFKGGFALVLSFVLAIIILTATSCEIGGYKEGKNYEIESLGDLLDALEDRGHKPKEIMTEDDEEQNSCFSVKAHNVDINGEKISVYEFKEAETASSQADTISEDGSTISDSKISRSDEANFYKKGNLIVIYIGNDRTLLFDLYAILGNPIVE